LGIFFSSPNSGKFLLFGGPFLLSPLFQGGPHFRPLVPYFFGPGYPYFSLFFNPFWGFSPSRGEESLCAFFSEPPFGGCGDRLFFGGTPREVSLKNSPGGPISLLGPVSLGVSLGPFWVIEGVFSLSRREKCAPPPNFFGGPPFFLFFPHRVQKGPPGGVCGGVFNHPIKERVWPPLLMIKGRFHKYGVDTKRGLPL